jgi:hypothetical protein
LRAFAQLGGTTKAAPPVWPADAPRRYEAPRISSRAVLLFRLAAGWVVPAQICSALADFLLTEEGGGRRQSLMSASHCVAKGLGWFKAANTKSVKVSTQIVIRIIDMCIFVHQAEAC